MTEKDPFGQPLEMTNDGIGGVEQSLDTDEIIFGAEGKPITRSQAWEIALQKGEGGKVIGPGGEEIRRAKALMMAMDQDFGELVRQFEMGMTEATHAYLDFAAKMHRYSSGNIDLIFMQAPHARLVQGFSAWTRGGYKLKSREESCQPIYILQPRPYRKIKRIDEIDEEERAEEEQASTVYYRAVPVYDASSIDERVKAVPQFFTPLQGNADMLTERLIEVLSEDGIEVKEGYATYQAQGGSLGGRIIVRPDLESVNRFLVLAHEAMHEWLHPKEKRGAISIQTRECQAEVGAFMLASHFGIQSPLSADYLRSYGLHKETLKENLKITREMAHKAIERMEEKYDLYAEFAYNPKVDEGRKPFTRKGKHQSKRKS
jgi:hypothetical protein